MAARKKTDSKLYYFVDIELYSRQIVGWGIESKERVEVHLTNGCHRMFISKGQYNKLVTKIEEARSQQ